MQLFRICPESRLEQFDGLGASYKDGARWNSAGHPALYFACSAAVALLEMAHYLPSPRLIPASYRLGVYQLADEVPVDALPEDRLPEGWAEYPWPAATQALGDAWLTSGAGLILTVPSCAVAGGLERSALFNPRHADAGKLKLVQVIKHLYNERAFAGISP